MLNKNKIKTEVYAYCLLVIGSLLFAVGDVMFVNPYLLAPGGTYGLSNVLNTVWPWKISYYAICMDIPLLLIGTWILGPKFGVKTVVSTILIFAFTWVLETTWGYNPVIHEGIVEEAMHNYVQIPHSDLFFIPDYFLNTVVGGVIYGIAIGLSNDVVTKLKGEQTQFLIDRFESLFLVLRQVSTVIGKVLVGLRQQTHLLGVET